MTVTIGRRELLVALGGGTTTPAALLYPLFKFSTALTGVQWRGHRLMRHEVGALGRLTLIAWRTSLGDARHHGPVERDVLARIRRPLKLEAERIDGTDR